MPNRKPFPAPSLSRSHKIAVKKQPRLLSDQDRGIFLSEAIDLFTGKRQGHMIHRMYMTPEALGFWSKFMEHDGYYVTRNEYSLIREFASAAAFHAQNRRGIIGIENGPGSESAIHNKSAVFFKAMPGLHTYVGRDWSRAVMVKTHKIMSKEFPDARIITDNTNFLKKAFPRDLGNGRKVMVEFGITRGNMEGFASHPFPTRILIHDMGFHRAQLNSGDLYVMTFDANQDKVSIEYAYTSAWLTEWGREMFRVMQRELPITGDFDPEAFRFMPEWSPEGHVNSNSMIATRDMEFMLGVHPIKIRRDERFTITNSYKTPIELFDDIVRAAGFEVLVRYQDKEGRMTMPILRAE